MIDTKHLNDIRPPSQRGDGGKPTGGSAASSRNSLRDGLRSKVIFPEEMAAAIAVRATKLTEQLLPQTELDSFLVGEMARSAVQIDACHDLLLVDARRVLDRVDTGWDDDRGEHIDKLAAKLAEDPLRVAHALERTKQGTQLKLSFWEDLNSAIETNQGLDEPQRQMAFDLLGVLPVLRNGNSKVPSGTDVPALQTLVARERTRLQCRLDYSLNDRDKADQGAARLGVAITIDATTRRLKSNQSRAQRRFTWALDTLLRLRQGTAPSSVIDPETKKPLAPEPEAPPAPEPARARPAPPPPPPPSRPPLPPLPEGCKGEGAEMTLVAGEALRAFMAAQNAALPTNFVPISAAKPPRG